MSSRFVARIVATVMLSTLAATFAFAAPRSSSAPAGTARTDAATFAGGCFWSMEAQFEGVPGVRSVTSGYTGGWKKHPTYEEVCSHTTGHLESVEVVFDPAVVTYAQLLDRFWHGIDPTQADGQFCDTGDSYRSAIFYRGDAQRQQALATKAALERGGVLHGPIVTRILAAGEFWPAEDYHQDFAKKNPEHYHRYREGCGRDRRLTQVWGKAAVRPIGY
jgi:peptide-methionine (S)-S-oxide reductase